MSWPAHCCIVSTPLYGSLNIKGTHYSAKKCFWVIFVQLIFLICMTISCFEFSHNIITKVSAQHLTYGYLFKHMWVKRTELIHTGKICTDLCKQNGRKPLPSHCHDPKYRIGVYTPQNQLFWSTKLKWQLDMLIVVQNENRFSTLIEK